MIVEEKNAGKEAMNMSVRLTKKATFNEVLDKIEAMPLEDQEILLDVVSRRHSEKKRGSILKNATESLREHKKGLTKEGTADDLLKDLK